MNKTWENIIKYSLTAVCATIIVALILLITSPLLYLVGWCTGWFAMITIGDTLVHGINIILGTSFSKEILPAIGGVLAWVGYFFKSGKTISTREKDK